MSRLGQRFPAADLPHVRLGASPTPVRRLERLGLQDEVWIKDEAGFGDGGWGGNKVRKLEWIIPEAHRRGRDTVLTVGGIGTHWGLAAALYGREHGLRTVLGLVEQPVDEHVREQLRRLAASGAVIHRYPTVGRLKLAAPWILARHSRRGRLPYYLPAGGSSAVGSLGYVETALEIAAQVEAGEMPEPRTLVTAVGSGGTAAGLALGLRLAGLRTRVLGIVVNDSFRLDAVTISRLANQTAALLRDRGADVSIELTPADVSATAVWMGDTYGATTERGSEALALAAEAEGLELEPVYTAKALAAVRGLDGALDGPVLFLQTHGPRPES
ncbi:1-aminocyclopropane-1-carboxylate deaminase [Aeromicrobium sp. A1-2]|uniref:1-aminocyclopropane-1-carboxylate deaminase/D-cysteine desulfhydrase n=1 Tax=Aeromicrobium sp. A1-2 TaxID=2107713 RepID=UPI000E4A5ABD|nr:pyridoxal-phosphate dependent enzyme [Aeromicrobium sp. A1-2]AXT85921.1 1-aminocyclopropane-1-carboxylate deaminase [Aeromicrobium sp. A1-2]